MSAPSDHTRFATHFDFESDEVSLTDLIVHLRILGMEPESIGIANGMACLAAADLLQTFCGRRQVNPEPGGLITTLRAIDHDTWGEMQ